MKIKQNGDGEGTKPTHEMIHQENLTKKSIHKLLLKPHTHTLTGRWEITAKYFCS